MLLIELSKSISNYLHTQGFAGAPELDKDSVSSILEHIAADAFVFIDIVAVVVADIHKVHHSIRNALRFLFCSYIFHDHISLITVHKDSDYFDMIKREAEKTDEIGHFFLLVLFCKVKSFRV